MLYVVYRTRIPYVYGMKYVRVGYTTKVMDIECFIANLTLNGPTMKLNCKLSSIQISYNVSAILAN